MSLTWLRNEYVCAQIQCQCATCCTDFQTQALRPGVRLSKLCIIFGPVGVVKPHALPSVANPPVPVGVVSGSGTTSGFALDMLPLVRVTVGVVAVTFRDFSVGLATRAVKEQFF